jgi:hypothetical protein
VYDGEKWTILAAAKLPLVAFVGWSICSIKSLSYQVYGLKSLVYAWPAGTYQNAFLANKPDFHDKVVLDVGTGTGILAFFAVQVNGLGAAYKTSDLRMIDLVLHTRGRISAGTMTWLRKKRTCREIGGAGCGHTKGRQQWGAASDRLTISWNVLECAGRGSTRLCRLVPYGAPAG